jgi:ankyrin repeat protein
MNGVAQDVDMVADELRVLEASKKGGQIMAPIRLAFATGDTPLHCAAQRGDGPCAKALLAKGAQVNATNKWGEMPLHYAAVFGEKDAVDELLKAGADVHAKLPNGMTPLDLARRSGDGGTVKLLEGKGALPGNGRRGEK